MKLVLAALEVEIKYLLEQVKIIKEFEILNVHCYLCEIEDKQFYVGYTKVGRTNAAMISQKLIDQFNIEQIISIGSAGCANEQYKIGDIGIGDILCYGDVDVTAFGYEYGQVPRSPRHFTSSQALVEKVDKSKYHFDIHSSCIITVEKFVNEDVFNNLNEKFKQIDLFEMESSAIAHVAYENQVDFLTLRAVSDFANKKLKSEKTYEENQEIIAKNLFLVIKDII